MSEALDLRRQIEALVLDDEGFRSLEVALSSYCPFESLGMINAEIRHSTFLASMLDPYRPHGFGPLLIREFLHRLIGEERDVPGLSRIRLHLADLDNVEVRREWSHIDVLLVLADLRLVIALELKIGAGEGRDQLQRYTRAVEAEWPNQGERPWTHLFFFLTRDGDEPSNQRWRPIDYGLVIAAIEDVLRRSPQGDPLARSMLAAYASMLRRHHMEDPELIEIAQGLWARHREALTFLIEQQPGGATALGEVIRAQADSLAAAASSESVTLILNDSTRRMTRFAIKQWDSLPGMLEGTGWTSGRIILLEIQVQPNRVRALLILGPGPAEIRRKLFDAIRPVFRRSNRTLTDKWTRLATFKLVSDNLVGEDFDQEKAFAELQKNFRTFVTSELPKFDAAVRKALTADP